MKEFNFKRMYVFYREVMNLKKIILAVILLVIGGAKAQAANITENKISNIFANQNYNGQELSASFGYMYADDIIAYCIDPGIPLKVGYYDKTLDFNYKHIDQTKKEKLQLIAYYGYQFPGHDTDKYYLATQSLIWETIGSTNISFTTERHRGGQAINIDGERKEILDNVNKVLTLPSFANTKVEGYLGESISLDDVNNNYFNFGYTSNNKNSYNFNNGKFNIVLKELGSGRINIIKKISSSKESALFYADGYQSLVTLGIDVTKEGYIDILVNDPNRVRLKINNYDKNDNSPLKNSYFKIKDLKTNRYLSYKSQEVFITDVSGTIIYPDYINSGQYQLEQIQVDNDYILSDQKIIFDVNKNTPTINIDGEQYLNIDFHNTKKVIGQSNDIKSNFDKMPQTSDRYTLYNILLFLILIIGIKCCCYAKKSS